MAAYDAYVSFSVPATAAEDLKKRGYDPKDNLLQGERLEAVKRALDEFSQTPEGRETLRKAAENSPTGKVEIFSHNGPTAFAQKSVIIGNDHDFRYEGMETGRLHAQSIQSALMHELQHAALDHSKKRGDEDPKTNISESKELEAIRATNEYMRKYYGEPLRSETLDAGDFKHTSRWYINPNFKAEPAPETPENYRRQIAELTPAEVEKAGPELASLYEFRNHPERFMEQYRALEAEGGIEFAQADLTLIQREQMKAPKPEAPKPDAPDQDVKQSSAPVTQFAPG